MTLAAGYELSHYRIVERIGEGGMGVVWKATDLTLGRSAAIKVLPEAFAGDPERMARFEREARVLAAFNHPHIASIYGVGSVDGIRFLAMELVEGDDLAQRIARGPLPLVEALELARQVADALEAAHEKGIIHRDLKPANVKLTPQGQVKVLDFGLAKALESDPGTSSSAAQSYSPTITSPMTAANVIPGTPAYMSPEQARGKPVDRRTDIWAFGSLLYECLTGRRAFEGETVSDTIAKILEREPDWAPLPAGTPARVRELLRRCLEKDSRKRLRDIGDARLELDDVLAGGVLASGALATDSLEAAAGPRRGSSRLAWGVATAAIAIAVAAMLVPNAWRRTRRPVAARTSVSSPAGMRISTIPADAAISPDGTMLVFAAADSAGRWRLYLRPLESLEARPLAGTEFGGIESPGLPFWSPDSRWIGFFAEDKLKTIRVAGGTPQVLCNASNARGGTWNRAGVILFAPSSQGPLFRVSSSGGEPVQVTVLDSTRHETAHRFPHFLPDGRHFHFVSFSGQDPRTRTWTSELGSTRRTLVMSAASGAVFVPPGHMVFTRGRSLMAQPFDPGRLRLTGEPVRIGDAPEDLSTLGTNPASGSENETLVYPASPPASSRLTWLGRDGRAQGDLGMPEGDYRAVAFGPDGRQVALLLRNASADLDVWIADVLRGGMTRLTTDGGEKASIRWSDDGRAIVYGSLGSTEAVFFEVPVSGGEAKRLVVSSSVFANLTQITRDRSYLVYDDLARTTQRDLWVTALAGGPRTFAYLRTPFNETGGSISPDGRWMLYQSDESGRMEVYVQSFPTPGHKVRISNGGGEQAAWRNDGAEILYLAPRGLMSVAVRGGSELVRGEPALLFADPTGAVAGAVTPDFRRLLAAMTSGDNRRPSLTVLTNWTSLLAR